MPPLIFLSLCCSTNVTPFNICPNKDVWMSTWEQLTTGINNINKTATIGCHKEHDCRY